MRTWKNFQFMDVLRPILDAVLEPICVIVLQQSLAHPCFRLKKIAELRNYKKTLPFLIDILIYISPIFFIQRVHRFFWFAYWFIFWYFFCLLLWINLYNYFSIVGLFVPLMDSVCESLGDIHKTFIASESLISKSDILVLELASMVLRALFSQESFYFILRQRKRQKLLVNLFFALLELIRVRDRSKKRRCWHFEWNTGCSTRVVMVIMNDSKVVSRKRRF